MSEETIAHQELLMRVAEALSKTPSATDHLMLTKWRIQSICQCLLGDPPRNIEEGCCEVLEAFALHGAGEACDKALKKVGAIIKQVETTEGTVLPTISREKRAVVARHLDSLTANGTATIEQALQVLPSVRERMRTIGHAVLLLGVQHRLELVASYVEDVTRIESERTRAAAAVLYVDEERDVIPDTLGVIGMVDDDYALRIVLDEISGISSSAYLHWSEIISSLWDELPFLQGMNLQRGDRPISVTWLDRVNSFISYSHVMGSEKMPLMLLQPSIVSSPLHTIVSLIGLLVLDAVTSSENKAHSLRKGQTYEFDNLVVRFEGTDDSRMPGWLRLRVREDVIIEQPPNVAYRMVPIEPRRLSSQREFSAQSCTANIDPVQQFFDWRTAIGPASITSCLVLVASQRRMLDLLEDVQSNGVRLLDHGLVQFLGTVPERMDTYGTLVLVVPSLSTVRQLLDRGVLVQAILVDGYDHLYRGRHELPFLINRRNAPPIIEWLTTGYCPAAPPTWLQPHRRLEASSEELASILELDDTSTDLDLASLWEAATGIAVRACVTPVPAAELSVVQSINAYLQTIRSSHTLPEYWQYHLTKLARTLRALVASTPAEWSEIERFASAWSSSIDEKWLSLRPSAIATLTDLRDAEKQILKLIKEVPDAVNSRADALVAFLSNPEEAESHWYLVCDRPEQAKAAAAVIGMMGLRTVEPTLLRDLAVCRECLVVGWVNSSFARRLWAHTPRKFVALTDDNDRRRWERAAESQRQSGGQSLLDAVRGLSPPQDGASSSPVIEEDPHANDDGDTDWGTDERVPCVFLWVTGESDAKVLEPDGRVVVEEGDIVRDRVAAHLHANDRVILGLGSSRWSPADEFTGAVIDAVKASHPELVKTAKEWRRALRQLIDSQRLSTSQLRTRLANIGVRREEQTLEGWLDIDRASPIAPRGVRTELAALWPLVAQLAQHSLDDVAAACARLRALRAASGRSLLQLWKGKAVELGVDEAWLEKLVDRLRLEVRVYEVEAVTFGQVPRPMLGWWIPPTLTGRCGCELGPASSSAKDDV